MLWWIAAALFVALATWFFRRQWIAPWKELERLVGQIIRGEQPRTFLVSGNPPAWRIGAALENLLKRQQQLDNQIAQESSEMRALFANLADALVVLDSNQRIRFWNPAFEQLFASRVIAAGTSLLEITRNAEVLQTVRAALEQDKAIRTELTRSEKTFQFAALPIRGEHEQLSSVIAIFHDISQLKQTDQIRRDFVANVSHELRTPLSIFRGNLETLLEEENLNREETRQIFSTMKRHSDRLNRLVEDLLTLARLESSETKLQLEPIDLAEFLERVGRDWSKRLAQKNLRLEVQVKEKPLSLQADEFRLEQLMHNLLDNAVNYSPEGGRITASASKRDDFAVLSVTDEGPGIPRADLPRIFERFYRADKARSQEKLRGSTGLGLSIVKHIAQLHGGDVRAQSELGKGTTVYVSLPARSAESNS